MPKPLTKEQQLTSLSRTHGITESNLSNLNDTICFRGFNKDFKVPPDAIMGSNGCGLTPNPNDTTAEFTNAQGFNKGLVCTSLSADTAARYAGTGGIVYITAVDKAFNVSRDFDYSNKDKGFGKSGNEQQITALSIGAEKIIGCARVESYENGQVKFGKIEWSDTFLKKESLTKDDMNNINPKDVLSKPGMYGSSTSIDSITNDKAHAANENPNGAKEPYNALVSDKFDRKEILNARKALEGKVKTDKSMINTGTKKAKSDYDSAINAAEKKSQAGFKQFATSHNESPEAIAAQERIDSVIDARKANKGIGSDQAKTGASELSSIINNMKSSKEVVSSSQSVDSSAKSTSVPGTATSPKSTISL